MAHMKGVGHDQADMLDVGPIGTPRPLGYSARARSGTVVHPRAAITSVEPEMPLTPKDAPQKVCSGCGTATFLLYSIRTGEPAIAVERAYCSLACARLHFPTFTPPNAGR
jgi:hypothetical protein